MADGWITAGEQEAEGDKDEKELDIDLSGFDGSDDDDDDDDNDAEPDAKPSSDAEKAGILNELRETRSALKDLKKEQHQREAILQERLDHLTRSMEDRRSSDAAPSDPAPDKEEDPVGFLIWQQEQNAKQNEKVIGTMQEQQNVAAMQQQQQAIRARTMQAEKEFLESEDVKREDYDHTLDVFRNLTTSILNLQGYDERQIPNLVSAIEYNIVSNMLKRGDNPAKSLYRLVNNSQFASKVSESAGNGPDNLARMRRGKSAATSLSKARGGAQKRRITLDDLASMSPADFEKVTDNPKAWERINIQGYIDI